MRRLIPALFLALVLAGVMPAIAEEAPAPLAPVAAAEETVLPADLTELFNPEPIKKIGFQYGPCTVSVKCLNGQTIQCSGQNSCYWNIDRTTWAGYVKCDGQTTTCQHNLVPEP